MAPSLPRMVWYTGAPQDRRWQRSRAQRNEVALGIIHWCSPLSIPSSVPSAPPSHTPCHLQVRARTWISARKPALACTIRHSLALHSSGVHVWYLERVPHLSWVIGTEQGHTPCHRVARSLADALS